MSSPLRGRLLCGLATLALLSPAAAYGWGDHYMVTDRALSHESMAFTSEKVKVEPLEDFLAAQPEALAKLFDEYYAWLAASGATRFTRMSFDPANPTKEAFLRAARMNPATIFALVERVLPDDQSTFEEVPFAAISPYLKETPPLRRDFRDTTGQEVTIRSVLYTFADEPDWGMDHSLFAFSEYGYGEQPYGKPEGESSKAPFHMKFAHENFLVRKFAHKITESMAQDRVELFLRLSRLALKTGHPYWGYRFAAWSFHYIQDLGQPYHSKAVPGKGAPYYIRYVLSFRKDRIQERTTQVEANRHFLYEDFVSYSMQQSYLTKEEAPAKLVGYLSSGEAVFAGISDSKALLEKVMDFAAEHAREIDRTIVKAFGPKLTKDPEYDMEKDPSYKISEALAKIPPDKAERLLVETGEDFAMTGRATRTLIGLARAN